MSLTPAKIENLIKELRAKQESEDFWKDNETGFKVGNNLELRRKIED